MSIREVFGRNLARLVGEHGSIEQIAKALSLDRQQLYRYVRGDQIPNETTRSRLSKFFQITEESLFQIDGDGLSDVYRDVLRRVIADPPNIAPGTYATYFWTPDHQDTIVGAATIVRTDNEATTFRRLTAIAERRGTKWTYIRGDHQGIVSERQGWIYFHGSNRIAPFEPTFLTLKWAVMSEPFLSGHGIVTTMFGPTSIKVVMQKVNPPGLKSALKFSCTYDLNDRRVPHAARLLLGQV